MGHRFVLFNYWFCIQSIICFIINYAESQQLHNHHPSPYYNSVAPLPQKCSRKLEDTLDSMVHKNRLKFGSGRTRIDVTPYSRYHSLYGNFEDFDSASPNEKLDLGSGQHRPNEDDSRPVSGEKVVENLRRPVDKIEVAEMRVRVPNHQKEPWVRVDRCQFNANNRTLDTRLVFPDLTISGRVILQPSGGYCSMILRLRRAGIEFRTTPLAFGGVHSENGAAGTGRAGPASVRTDSHFSEPGFLSVFAHGCQGPTGIKFRKNSKRNRFDYPSGQVKDYGPSYDEDPIKRSGSRYYNNHHRRAGSVESKEDYRRNEYHRRSITDDSAEDLLNFNEDFISGKDDDYSSGYSSRTFGELFSWDSTKFAPAERPHRPHQSNWYNAELANSNEVNDALTQELEQLFSIGVRGLLTTYMQKALQPAIKETLMENMGYVLSYG